VAAPNDDAELFRDERRALGWAALAAVAVIVWLVRPIGMGVLLGVLMAFTFQPMYERASARSAPAVAALVTVVGATLAVAVPFAGIVWLLVSGGTALAPDVAQALGPGGAVRHLALSVAQLTSKVGITAEDLLERARALAGSAVAGVARFAEAVASATASATLALLFLMMAMYAVLRHGRAIGCGAQDILPLRPEYTRRLFEEFRRVGRTTLLGTLVSAVVQGVLAAVGYTIVGLPRPEFFGALTAVASPLPGIGTMLVWVPAGVVLIAEGHVGRGVLMLVWGVLVVTGVMDYVVRPRLIGRESHVPALLTFAALFGGAKVFGLKGLILGPVLMSIAIAALRIYADERRERRRAAGIDAPAPPGGAGRAAP